MNTIRVANRLDPDQARPEVLSGLIWVQTILAGLDLIQIVCKGYKQCVEPDYLASDGVSRSRPALFSNVSISF